MMSRTGLITSSSFAGSLGWGMILPFQYAYVVDARGWGALAGVLTGTVFCLGAVIAAPLAGRLTDRYSAGSLAVAFPLVAAVSSIALGVAGGPLSFLVAMAVFGAAVTALAPPTQVLILEAVPVEDRRAVFAYQFTAMALGMAVGAFAAGHVIDLGSPDGMLVAFLGAAAGFFVSAALIVPAALAASSTGSIEPAASDPLTNERGSLATYVHLARNRQVRLLALVSIALAAGFYAQFDTGLPAFALSSLGVEASTIGTAAAVNCLVIVGLQWLVIKVTKHHSGPWLLVIVATIWAMTWLLLEAAIFTGAETASTLFVLAFAIFALGETMYSPVLSPLAAAVAPPGLVGTTLGALAALRTGISAAGPLVAGILVALDLPHVFVLLHVAINAAAAVLAWRLLRARSTAIAGQGGIEVDNGGTDKLRSAHV
jgi:MFS family permease